MSIPRKNKLWKEMYLYAQDNDFEILRNKDFEGMFQDIIVEHLTTGIDIKVLLAHKNNNLNPIEKTKEYIDNAVEILIQELAKKEEDEVLDFPTIEKRSYKKGKK